MHLGTRSCCEWHVDYTAGDALAFFAVYVLARQAYNVYSGDFSLAGTYDQCLLHQWACINFQWFQLCLIIVSDQDQLVITDKHRHRQHTLYVPLL